MYRLQPKTHGNSLRSVDRRRAIPPNRKRDLKTGKIGLRKVPKPIMIFPKNGANSGTFGTFLEILLGAPSMLV